jgi:hypothetical protein
MIVFLVSVLLYTVTVVVVSANGLQVTSTVTLQDYVEGIEGMVTVAERILARMQFPSKANYLLIQQPNTTLNVPSIYPQMQRVLVT